MNKHIKIALAAGTVAMACSMGSKELRAQQLSKSVAAGKNVYELAVDERNNVIYVASVGLRNDPAFTPHIYAFDAGTLEKKDSIKMEHGPAFGLAINTKTQTLYTSNTVSNSVSAIDLRTGKQTKISNGKEESHTRELLVDEQTNTIYVSDVVGREAPGRIWVIDGTTNTLKQLIETGGSVTAGLALNRKRNQIYYTNYGSNEIGVIDLTTGKVIRTYAAGGEQPTNLAYDTEGDRLFVTNQKTANVTVLSPTDGKVLATIPTGAGALGIRLDDKRNRLYVANRQAGTVTVVDAKTYTVLDQLETGTHPNTVVVAQISGKAYVTNKAAMQKPDEEAKPDPNGDTLSLISH